jgi:hypothetical protein
MPYPGENIFHNHRQGSGVQEFRSSGVQEFKVGGSGKLQEESGRIRSIVTVSPAVVFSRFIAQDGMMRAPELLQLLELLNSFSHTCLHGSGTHSNP